MRVRGVRESDRAEWLRLRDALWPGRRETHELEVEGLLATRPRDAAVFVAEREPGRLGGLAEASVRGYAEGCTSPRVAYLEGWWVEPALRGTGTGRALVAAVEDWARSLGLSELASDSELANADGQAAHRALGFQETARLVCFRKGL